MKLAQLLKAIKENESLKPKGLSLGVLEFLKDLKSKEEVVEEFSDADINEMEMKDLFGPETEDLITQLVIEQASFLMANWILNSNASDFNKEEIAYAFTHDYQLTSDEDSSDLLFSLYTQGFLTDKEKNELLTKANQSTILSLTLHYQDSSSVLNFLNKLDDLNLSLFLQNHQVKTLSEDTYQFLKSKNKLSGKNALSALMKTKLSALEQSWLVTQALEEKDSTISYFILTQVDIQDVELKRRVIKQALKYDYFTYSSLSPRVQVEVDEFVVIKSLYTLEEDLKTKKMMFGTHTLASLDLSTQEIKTNSYYSPEIKQLIKIQLTRGQVELPDLIKGEYNFQEGTFIPYDKAHHTEGITFTVDQSDKDFNSEALRLWKPNVRVPAILEKKGNKFTVKPKSNELDLEIPLWKAENLTELHHKITNRINFLTENLKLNPMNSSRPFGVEIELCMRSVRPSDLALTLEAEDLSMDDPPTVNSSKKSALNNWAVKKDLSLRHLDEDGNPIKTDKKYIKNLFTAEIITPKLYGTEGLNEVREKLNTLLSEYGNSLSVNVTCGLHVHHDMSEFFTGGSAKNDEYEPMLREELAKIQESLYSLCSENRRTNTFCPRFDLDDGVHDPDLEYTESDYGSNIPRPGFNLFTGFSTIEFRMHEATLNVEQIVNWITITHHVTEQVVNKVLAFKNQAATQLTEVLKLMEIEKLKKVQSEADLEKALAEINEFIKNNAWAKVLINT